MGLNIGTGEAEHIYIGNTKVHRMYLGEDKFFSDSDLVAPVVASRLQIGQVEYEVTATGKSVRDAISSYTGVNSTARAFGGLKSRLFWRMMGAHSFTLDTSPSDSRFPNAVSLAGDDFADVYDFTMPLIGLGNYIPFRITGTNPEGSTSSIINSYSVWDDSRKPILEIARFGVHDARTSPRPGGGQVTTGRAYLELRTNGVVKRVRILASDGQSGNYEDQTNHMRAGLVTGSRSGIFNAGYYVIGGVGFNFVRNGAVWDPSFRIRVEMEVASNTLDVSGQRALL